MLWPFFVFIILFDVNALDNLGSTALMQAANSIQPEVVQLLIDHGADINLKDWLGETALDKAKKVKSQEIAEMIKAAAGATG